MEDKSLVSFMCMFTHSEDYMSFHHTPYLMFHPFPLPYSTSLLPTLRFLDLVFSGVTLIL